MSKKKVAQEVTRSDRGFGFLMFPAISGTPLCGCSAREHDGAVRVFESSAAFDPYIWVSAERTVDHGDVEEISVHLTLKNAKRLRDQIDYLIKNHHQVVDH